MEISEMPNVQTVLISDINFENNQYSIALGLV